MSSKSRRQYSAEFEREAIALVTQQGNNLTKAARNLGVIAKMLRRWKGELAWDGKGAFPGKGYQTPEQEKIRRLRGDVKHHQMERDILKKATAFFGSETS